MLMIRFQRIGRTNDPAFRIVLLEKTRAAKAGNITEQLGTYNPKSKALTLDEARVKEWIAKGAQPTDTIKNLLITKGIIEGKKVNVLPKKTPIKEEVKEEAKPAAAAPVAPVQKAEEPVAEVSAVTEPTVEEIVAEAEEETPVAEEIVEEASVVEEASPEETPAA